MIQFLSCSEVIVSEKCSEKQIRMITYLRIVEGDVARRMLYKKLPFRVQ